MEQVSAQVTEKVALGYLELGIAGAALLTIIILALVFLRWTSKQRDKDRMQFSEQLNAQREDSRAERVGHVDEMKTMGTAQKDGLEKMADAITEQTGTFQSTLMHQQKDFTGAMHQLTKDQIDLAKLRAAQDAKKKED